MIGIGRLVIMGIALAMLAAACGLGPDPDGWSLPQERESRGGFVHLEHANILEELGAARDEIAALREELSDMSARLAALEAGLANGYGDALERVDAGSEWNEPACQCRGGDSAMRRWDR